MFKKTLIAILCSTALVACGGSSDDSNPNPNPSVPANDLDKAKQLVNTTNTIISYFENFENLGTEYKPAFDAIGNTGSDIGHATGLVLTLASLAYDDAKGTNKTYDATALQELLDEEDYIDYQLSGSSFKVTTTASSVSIEGAAKVKYWVDGYWDNTAQKWVDTFGDDATVTVAGLKLEAPFTASDSTYNFKILAGGKIATKNAANKEASFSFKSDSTANAVYTTAKKLDDRNTNETPKTAEFKLANLEFSSNNVVMTLGEFSSKAQTVSIKDGTTTKVELIPTEITFKGQTKLDGAADHLALDASIKLNNALTGTIDVTNDESASNFINADLNIKISGNLKDGKKANKPFSVDLAAKRAEYQKGTANVVIAVDTDKLTVASKTDNLIGSNPNAEHEPTVSAKISHSNGAYVDIADVGNFKSADIKVGSTIYGTIQKQTQSLYSAKFNDNTSITIAP